MGWRRKGRESVNEQDGKSRCMLDCELSIATPTSVVLSPCSYNKLWSLHPHPFSLPLWPRLGLLSGA
ncbi:hypothetical protein PBY51_008738 [Eleginops maclovinus]|uniref:Uncharacterized protein n=1 Tax=Eleginops maclovinus TaxID=56733 RepID=A0AAN7WX48_ELEMC|nr:hypothetical protein PBY51_008738 [Eleginops maclovinus]